MQTIIDPKRLFQAADALLEAIHDGPRGLIVVHVGAEHEAPPGTFKPAELVEAMTMLLRLGLVPGDLPG